jgi:putative flippase GtrA
VKEIIKTKNRRIIVNHPFFRFLLVGVVNTVVGLSVMYFLHHVAGLSYWSSTFSGNSIGAIISYFLNKTFTFKSKNPFGQSALRFISVILICYFISFFLGKQIVGVILQPIQFISDTYRTDIAILMGTGLYTISNYFGQKLLVFQKSEG